MQESFAVITINRISLIMRCLHYDARGAIVHYGILVEPLGKFFSRESANQIEEQNITPDFTTLNFLTSQTDETVRRCFRN